MPDTPQPLTLEPTSMFTNSKPMTREERLRAVGTIPQYAKEDIAFLLGELTAERQAHAATRERLTAQRAAAENVLEDTEHELAALKRENLVLHRFYDSCNGTLGYGVGLPQKDCIRLICEAFDVATAALKETDNA